MKKNTILLITGAILTLLFIIFSTPLFESLFYSREFSNEMYAANLYLVVAIVTAVVAWGLSGIYYYVINSVSFSRWYHWLIMLCVAVVIVPLITYVSAVEAVLFIIASYSMRWWSSNCRHTPIPE